MTAGAQENDGEQKCTGDVSMKHETSSGQIKSVDTSNCGSFKSRNCDMDVWEDARQNQPDYSSETSPMLANCASNSTSISISVKSQHPYNLPSCDLPSIHVLPSHTNGDDHSALSSSSLTQSSFLYCTPSEVDHRYRTYRGTSVPADNGYQARASSSKGGGCSVLLDKSVDLIELTTEDDALAHDQLTRCTCSDKDLKRWRFSRTKCRSLDCNAKYLPTFQKNIVSCLSTIKNLDDSVLNPRSLQSSADLELPCCNANSTPTLEYDCNLTTMYSGSCLDQVFDSATFNRSKLLQESDKHNSSVEEEVQRHSFTLTPRVNLSVFETESSSDEEENIGVNRGETCNINCDYGNVYSSSSNCLNNLDYQLALQTVSAPLLNKSLPFSPSAAQLSLASTVTDGGAPICKICHMTSKDGDPLISPCRCSGTMQFIHCGCLMHWLEISSKKSRKPPSCELCQYQYHWHKKFKVRHWQFPHCSRRDKVLHVLFFISVLIMIGCATITIMCFKQDRGTKVDPDRTELTESEIMTLVCGVLFFLAFFVAMYVEVKARSTIYKLVVRFVYLNQQWYIDEYEKKESAPVSV